MLDDLTGLRFGKLTVISLDGTRRGKRNWKCQCDCGNIHHVVTDDLKKGRVKSCGCYQHEKGYLQETHGDSKRGKYHRLYKIWADMKNRCNCENNQRYRDYGSRGIKVCEAWNAYEAFKDWALHNGYDDHLTIDRMDVDGDYEPGNCRWATYRQQNNNKRNGSRIACNGETHTIAEWSRITGIPFSTLQKRLHVFCWDVQDALFSPPKKRGSRMLSYDSQLA